MRWRAILPAAHSCDVPLRNKMGLNLNKKRGATDLRLGLRSGALSDEAAMRRKRLGSLAMLALACLVMGFAGCEDSARPRVAYHPPSVSPSPASAPPSQSAAPPASSSASSSASV